MNTPVPIQAATTSGLACQSGLSTSIDKQRLKQVFSWRGYFLQVVAVGIFYGVGLYFTLRGIFFQCQSGEKKAEGWGRHRHELAGGIDWFFGLLEGWGLMVVEDRLGEGDPLSPGTLLVANHPALFDAFFILRQWPDSSCVMRAGLMRSPAFRGGAEACGFIANDMGVEFVREAMARLQAKENLIIFPEGTRTLPGTLLNEFKKGFALLAVKTGVPVQTVLIEQEGEFLRKGSHLFWPTALPLFIRLRRGEVFRAEEGEMPEVLAGRVERYFNRSLEKAG